jgi:hypothetical protein
VISANGVGLMDLMVALWAGDEDGWSAFVSVSEEGLRMMISFPRAR